MTTILPIDTRRGRNCELRLARPTSPDAKWAVGLFPIGNETGIAIGVGASCLSALSDAQDTLQAARWAINDAILEAARERDMVPGRGTTGAGGNRGGVPPAGGEGPQTGGA
jgi:hypothetical protein